MSNCCRECGQELPPADDVKFWYGHDGHYHTPLKGTVAEVAAEAIRIASTPEGRYGLLLWPTVLRNGKEVRRVGDAGPFGGGACVHMGGADDLPNFIARVAEWVKVVSADPDVARLVP